MEHQATLLLTIVLGLVVAFVFGFIASKLRLPPLVGYLVAGIALGPFTPGITVNSQIATELSEVGVILLMFGVGLHFNTDDLLAVKWIAIPGAVSQIALATLIGMGLALCWGWSLGAGLVLGLSLSIASTVVLLRALEERNTLNTANGRIAVGWLIVEDLATVVVLVLLPALAGMLGGTPVAVHEGEVEPSLTVALLLMLGKLLVFAGLIAVVGRRVVPWTLRQAARTGSHELFTLAVLSIALGIAYASAAFFNVSFALGAFCAGVVLSKSELSHRAAAESLPMQHVFAVLFFVSVGMLFDPHILVQHPMKVVWVMVVILAGKAIGGFAIVLFLGYPVSTGTMIAASLTQVGEFSFILAGLGISLGLFPTEGRDLILAGAILSIILNPLAFAAIKPATNWINRVFGFVARGEPRRRERFAALQQKLQAVSAHDAAHQAVQPAAMMGKFPIFAELNDAQKAELLTLFKPKSAAPGERVIRAGQVGNKMYFISSGMVEVDLPHGKVRLGPGDFFGEMALLTGERRRADVTALDYCLFLTLGVDQFQPFIASHPELKVKLDAVVAERMKTHKPSDHPEEER